MCKEDIAKLKEMTANLPSLHDLIAGRASRVVQYSTDDGVCVGLGLFKNKDIAVQQNIMSVGTQLECHHHEYPIVEHIHVYKGKMKFVVNEDDVIIVSAMESITLRPEEPHRCIALEDTEMIAITMPADKAFPDA